MIDTSRPRVINDERSGPYIWVTIDQIKGVEQILQAHNVPYWVDQYPVSVNGGPFLTVININEKCDPNLVQSILDAAG